MPEKYSRRDFLTGVLVCGTLSTAAISLFPGSRPLGHAELTLLTGSDSTGARQLLIDMWNRANPNTTVRMVNSVGETGDQKRQMETGARNGTVDIVNLDTIHTQSFVDQELISAVDVDDAALFVAPTIRGNQVSATSDRLWAVPFNTDVGMLFERLPAGARREEAKLSTIIDRIADGSMQFVGQLSPTSSASHEAFVVNVFEHALSRNDKIIDANGIPAYDLGAWQDALEPLQKALTAQRIVAASSEDESVARFATDPKPRYMRNWPVAYRTLQKNVDLDTRSGRIEVGKLPIGILGGQSLAVVASSPHRDRAAEVIRFLTGEQAQKVLAAHGLAPTRLSAYADPNLQAFIPHLISIRGAVEEARPRPAHRHYEAFAQAVVNHVRRFLIDNIELPSKFIDDMRDALA